MTMTIPQTFTGDTYLSSQKLQANFDYIKTTINAGVASTDLSATAGFTLSQTSENRHPFFVDIAYYSPLGITMRYNFPVFVECELYDVSVLAKKSTTDVNDTQIHFNIKSGSNVLATVDLSEADDLPGYSRFSPAIAMSPGFYSVGLASTDSGNLTAATIRLGFLAKHTKR